MRSKQQMSRHDREQRRWPSGGIGEARPVDGDTGHVDPEIIPLDSTFVASPAHNGGSRSGSRPSRPTLPTRPAGNVAAGASKSP